VSAGDTCRVDGPEFDASRTRSDDGVIADASRTRSDDEVVAQHCITCGDDGTPMTVVRVDPERGLALCAHADGSRETVEIALVDPVTPGDELLVHAGTALARLSAGEEPAA
jgi:hydrogenase maturation factor